MRVRKLFISNFRGVSHGVVDFVGHTLLVGGNNVGKSTVCEALDLVLGPERLSRRPVVSEHDFFQGKYLDAERHPIEIRIQTILTDLSSEAEKRFHTHLRRWNEVDGKFADESTEGPEAGDRPGTCWCLPIVFIGKYDAEDDDFVGNTFFDHPHESADDSEEAEESRLGSGRDAFNRTHKRLCGFLFLRGLRTGSRALTLQRGSLLDTILRLPDTGLAEMWHDTLTRLKDLDPAIGDIEQLKQISTEIRERMAQFVNLTPGDEPTGFFASDLTREHLREVVRLFVSVEPGAYLLPFQRLGTGSINLLVFALLTFIAELKDKQAKVKQTIIFAMEEPEIALPPHTQRRVTRFVLSEMGQAIVTSHSPYVIEQFNPQQIVVLNRDSTGKLTGVPIDLQDIKAKVYTRERRQFAEAVLARAVLVVEGATEASVFSAASTLMEQDLGPKNYSHFDIAGVTVFNAGGDGSVPRYGPFFKALGKPAFCLIDKQASPPTREVSGMLASYDKFWESKEAGIESLLTKEMDEAVLRRFLDHVKDRADFPSQAGAVTTGMTEAQVRSLSRKVLEERKGDNYGYAAILIGKCSGSAELPATVRLVLEEVEKTAGVKVKAGGRQEPPAINGSPVER